MIPAEQMLAKIKAALDARRDPDFFIAARTDAAGVEGVDAAIERCQLFVAAGADLAKPQGVDAIEDIKRVIREVDCPHMATLSLAAGAKRRSLEELQAVGVVAATFPSLALFAAAHAVRNVLRILKRENSLTATFDHLLPLEEYYALVGLKEQLVREEAYDQAAAALARGGIVRFRMAGPQKKGAGARPALPPYNAVQHLPLSDDRRWGFALTDVLSAARDAQESQHRGCC